MNKLKRKELNSISNENYLLVTAPSFLNDFSDFLIQFNTA